jgi:murein DD-endopeptidase MepM/ murein hydrolase activator NlpD
MPSAGAAATAWRRRLRRPPPAGALACVLRGGRILALLLAVTGCAVDGPVPVADFPPPGEPGAAPLPSLVPPRVTSRFGEWRSEGGGPRSARHAGIDFRAARGTPVLAAADGVVVRAGTQAYAGRYVALQHAPGLATVYYHLSAVLVEPGAAVRRGQTIGRAGASGNATAPHLHFAVCRRDGAQCGQRIEAGWADPAAHWVAGSPCLGAARIGAAPATRLTYPLGCVEDAAGDPASVAPPAARRFAASR